MYWVKKLIGICLLMLMSYSILITNTGYSSLSLSDNNRKALVIGNANYPERGKFVPLPNPLHNAQAIAQRLSEYGFAVTKVTDVDTTAMKDAIDKFTNSLNTDDVALVYFSGHGIVTACYRGEEQKNFLIPVQTVFSGKADICEDAVAAQWLINLLNERNGGTNILLLDTCRNLLLEDQGTNNSGEMVTMKAAGTFIGYASAPGRTSKGDQESKYSVFTAQFLEMLTAPHDALPLELLFKGVRTAVTTKAEELGFEQVPWDDNGLVGENFCFRIPCKSLVSPDTEEKLQQERKEKEHLEAENKQLKEQLDAANAKINEMPIETSKPVVINPPPRQDFEPEMVSIPAGSFKMGSPSNEEGRNDDEGPVHTAQVNAFQMGKYEITRGQFRAFVDASGYKTEAETGDGCYGWTGSSWEQKQEYNWLNLGFEQNDNHPVACVAWNDVLKYIQWLNNKTGKNYRLPTEAEWEYAARAGTTTARYWGNHPDQACLYANVADQTKSPTGSFWDSQHNCTDGYWSTAPVGQFQPNAFGLYDMLGNVWEWTCSLYVSPYNGSEKQCVSNNHANGALVIRGGSWLSNPPWLRAAARSLEPSIRHDNMGFRLIQD